MALQCCVSLLKWKEGGDTTLAKDKKKVPKKVPVISKKKAPAPGKKKGK